MCGGQGFGGGEQQSSAVSGGPLWSPGTNRFRSIGQRNLLAELLGPEASFGAIPGAPRGGALATARQYTSAPIETPDYVGAIRQPFEQAIRQGIGQFSADYARRGINRPENIEALVGSAAQNVAPQFAGYYAQQAQTPLLREDIRRQRMMDYLNVINQLMGATGGQSQQFSSVTQFANTVGPLIGASGQAASGYLGKPSKTPVPGTG